MRAIPYSRGRFFPLSIAASLLASGMVWPVCAYAQNAAPNPAAQAAQLKQDLGRLRLNMGRMLRAGDLSGDQKLAGDFLNLRVQMLVSEGFRTDLPQVRKDIMTELRIAHLADVKTAIGQMNSFYLDRFQTIAFEADPNKYHPVVRHNAMLMIGDLDQQQFDYTGRTPPVPLPAAVPVLVQAVADPGVHDVVRAAALVGLARHAELGIADKQKAEKDVLTELIKLLAQKQEPVTRDAGAHRFFRKRAAEILGLLGQPGTGGKEVLAALEAVVSDDEEPLEFRCEVARNLGIFNYPAPGPAPTMIGTLGDLAVEITKQDMMSSRGMRHYLHCLQFALAGPEDQPAGQPTKGLAESLPAAPKKTATELAARLIKLTDLIEKIGRNRQILITVITEEGENLKKWLATNQVAAAG